MPALELHGPCTFDGDVASVRVEGHGHAMLLERAPFEGGYARKVWLEGATISTAPPNPELSQPRLLVPVDVNKAESDYDVTYKAGLPIVVEITRGGEDGSFQGTLDRAPRCATEWCPVAWTGARKHVELYPAGEAPFALTRELPLGEAATSPAVAEKTAPPSVNRIEMSGASGRLSCADGGQDVAGDWRWPGRGVRDLWLGPVEVTGRTLHVVVKNLAQQGTLEPMVPDGGAAALASAASAASSGQDPVDHHGQDKVGIGNVVPVAVLGVAVVVALVALRVRASARPLRDPPPPAEPSTPIPKEAPNMTKLPDPVVKAYRAGKLALFVGSGMSLGGDVKGGFPLWGQIPGRLLDACARYDALDDEAIALKRAQFKSAAQRHYLLLRNPTDGDRDRLERVYNVRVIAYAEHGEVPEILARLAAAKAG